MDKRYQVFVSSTFEDLREERAIVISALLQLDCFPAGMELFPAADDDSLTLIRSVIDDSDYYLIILGGRYGTLERSASKSYTHLEYEYAIKTGKPTIALLHSNPGTLPADRTESNDEGKKRFSEFRTELRSKNCRHWADKSELTAAVFTGIQHLKRTRPAQGWIRAIDSNDESLKDELLRLRRELEVTSAALTENDRFKAPTDTENLASGQDSTEILLEFPDGDRQSFYAFWDDIFRGVLPQTLGAGADGSTIAMLLVSLAKARDSQVYFHEITPYQWENASASLSSLAMVINQMVALGLIEGLPSPAGTVWRATPYGAKEGCRRAAVLKRRSKLAEANDN